MLTPLQIEMELLRQQQANLDIAADSDADTDQTEDGVNPELDLANMERAYRRTVEDLKAYGERLQKEAEKLDRANRNHPTFAQIQESQTEIDQLLGERDNWRSRVYAMKAAFQIHGTNLQGVDLEDLARISQLETQLEALKGELAKSNAKRAESIAELEEANAELEEANAELEEANTKWAETNVKWIYSIAELAESRAAEEKSSAQNLDHRARIDALENDLEQEKTASQRQRTASQVLIRSRENTLRLSYDEELSDAAKRHKKELLGLRQLHEQAMASLRDEHKSLLQENSDLRDKLFNHLTNQTQCLAETLDVSKTITSGVTAELQQLLSGFQNRYQSLNSTAEMRLAVLNQELSTLERPEQMAALKIGSPANDEMKTTTASEQEEEPGRIYWRKIFQRYTVD
jgi:hypothetical protein